LTKLQYGVIKFDASVWMDKDGLIDALRHIVVTPEQQSRNPKILTTTEGEVKSG
jgi:predicted RNA-binding protein associated with RNAse of E/G family